MSKILLFFLPILLINKLYAQSLHIDGFIGSSYISIIDKDANKNILNKEIWWHNKASIAVECYKHFYIGASLLNINIQYSDLFISHQQTNYIAPSILAYYKTTSKSKLSLDAGAEICRTNYDRNKNSVPVVGKYGYNLGHNLGLNYRFFKDWHFSIQNYLLWNISKQKLYFDSPITHFIIGIKYCNDWESE